MIDPNEIKELAAQSNPCLSDAKTLKDATIYGHWNERYELKVQIVTRGALSLSWDLSPDQARKLAEGLVRVADTVEAVRTERNPAVETKTEASE